jgi:hypothetical protein
MKKLYLAMALGATLFPATPVAAQSVAGDFVAAIYPDSKGAGGGLYRVDTTKGTWTALTGVTGDLVRARSITNEPYSAIIYYVGTTSEVAPALGDPNIYQVIMTQGKVVKTTKLNSNSLKLDVAIRSIRVVGDELWFLTKTRLAKMPKTGGKETTIFTLTAKNPVFDTDGRWIYTNLDSTRKYASATIYKVDSQDLTNWKGFYQANFPFPTFVTSLTVDGDGNVALIDRGNFSGHALSIVDPHGVKQLARFGLNIGQFGLSFPMQDPKTQEYVALGTPPFGSSKKGIGAVVYKNGKETKAFFGGGGAGIAGQIGGLAVQRSPHLHNFWHSCKSSFATEPRSWANGVPEPGNAGYAVSLEAPANTISILMFGAHGAVATPVPLANAGSCVLGVNPVLFLAGAVPATGKLSVGLPLPVNMSAAPIDIQWATLDAKANALGIITSQVGSIIPR